MFNDLNAGRPKVKGPAHLFVALELLSQCSTKVLQLIELNHKAMHQGRITKATHAADCMTCR